MSDQHLIRREGTMIYEDRPYREFDAGAIRVYGFSFDEQAVEQMRNVSRAGWVAQTALMADNHLGYSQPIGGVVGYREMLSPSGVGYDISCGVMAVRTNLQLDAVRSDLPRLADTIFERLSFGIGLKNPRPVEHELFDSPAWGEVPWLTEKVQGRKGPWSLRDRAESQLGTIGSGNHYVDLLVEPSTGELWIATHFGSRGFGHGIATGFLNAAAGREFFAGEIKGESMMAMPTLIPLTETAALELGYSDPAWGAELGRRYKLAMGLAGEYAYAGREYVIGQVLEILGAEALESVHSHHNYSWTETHSGVELEVVRKGATPAFPGQTGFVGGSMGDWSVVVRGVEGELAAKTLHSTVHGAGRLMSRTKLKGKVHRKTGRIIKPGLISREMVDVRLAEFRAEHGLPLVIRGADVDESPFAYRELGPVVQAHVETETIEVIHRMLPVAVCMAGPDVPDPWKD